jgi:phosphoribosylglycinamide formyltransferase-1
MVGQSPPYDVIRTLRVAVLASGRGTNLGALIDARRAGKLAVDCVLVTSDKADAPALRLAEDAGIETLALDPRGYANRAAFDADLFARIAAATPDLVVLAGFMRILDPAAIAPWIGRAINIHPSLLPKHRGLRTHTRALAEGDALHGASVHFVTAELDGGPVASNVEMAIETGDTAESLARRLLPLEHRLLVATVALIADGRLALDGDRVVFDSRVLAAPLSLQGDGSLAPR